MTIARNRLKIDENYNDYFNMNSLVFEHGGVEK